MDKPPRDWQPSQLNSRLDLQTENRLTRLEISSESHGDQIEDHEQRHDDQDVWNKGFTVALAGLGAGLAHAKAGDVLELIVTLLQRFRP